MEYAHGSLESIMYSWGFFSMMAMVAATNAESMAVKHAALTSISSNQPVPAPLIRMYVVLLTAYSMIMFYMFLLILCILLFCFMGAAHLSVEALFRLDPYWIRKRWVRWILFFADNLADPGLVFAFMTKRLWGAHLKVGLTSIVVGVCHAMMFVSRNRLKGMGVNLSNPLPPTLVPQLLTETNSVVLSVMTTLYMCVFAREVMLFFMRSGKEDDDGNGKEK